ncbi:MAG: hypothetical protein LBO82_00790 [Synergistaceae bacterium]|nr:hypothetical protein [Synergistaceae bacterium]
MALALAVMAVIAVAAVRFVKSGARGGRSGARVEVMASLPLGKDVFFVLRCGPEVFALTSGHAGTHLIGRWKYEEWLRWEEKEKACES